MLGAIRALVLADLLDTDARGFEIETDRVGPVDSATSTSRASSDRARELEAPHLLRLGSGEDDVRVHYLRLSRFDGEGRWLGHATFASASFPVAASNSLGVR